MMRQPLRTLLLVLLIVAASFSLVIRAVEYIAVRDQIDKISDFFSGVGTLSHRDGITVDVSEAIAYLSNNRYIGFYDRRRGFEGTLQNMNNAYIQGSLYWRASWVNRYLSDTFEGREYIDLLPRLSPVEGFAGFVSGDSFFYGELLDIQYIYQFPRNWELTGFYPHKILYVQVDSVLQGYPERLYEGQILRLRMDFPNFDGVWDSPLEDMEIGQRYFFKGSFYFMLERLQFDSRTITKFIKPLGEDGLWYIPVSQGEEIDPVALGIDRDIAFASHAQSAVYLRTTRDMNAIPYIQEGADLLHIRDGRMIDYDDYINSRPVVVIQRRFAERRRIGIGDTITVNVNASQHLVYAPYYIIGNPDDIATPLPITAYPEIGILSIPGAYPYITIELEVIGIFDLFRHRLVSTGWSSLDKFMFIPDSIIPKEWGLQSAYFGDIEPTYIPALWYSFVLNNPRDRASFLWDTRDTLAEMGFRVDFFGRDGSDFWMASDVILMSTTINLIMFSAVSMLVLALTAFLYLRQRNRDYAILRSLGCPNIKIFGKSVSTLMIFGLPAVLIGAIAGWFYANAIVEDTVVGFGEIVAEAFGRFLLPSERAALLAYYTEAAPMSIAWLWVLIAAIFITLLLFVTIGHILSARKSVLATLQNRR